MAAPDSILPIPAATSFKADDEGPSHSHVLASQDQLPVKCFAPLPSGGEPEVVDLGWHPDTSRHNKKAHSALDGKVENEEVWTLIRRFDKQVQHIKVVNTAVPGGLDMNIAEDEEFSPNKLGINMERLYMTVVVGMVSFAKHMARLRSWQDFFRTSCFFVAYFAAWWFDYLLPVLVVLFMLLITVPPARSFLFPPLGAKTTLKAAAKKNKLDVTVRRRKTEKQNEDEQDGEDDKENDDGEDKKDEVETEDKEDDESDHDESHTDVSKAHSEAVEADATSFVNTFGNIALSSAIGKEDAKGGDDNVENLSPDFTSIAMQATDTRNESEGDPKNKKKKPVGEVMWELAGPATHALGEVADMWERIANALSPTPPFPKHVARLRIASLFIPVLGVSMFISSYLILKTAGFAIGIAFFGSPMTVHIEKVIEEHVGEIRTIMQARNTILKGVPTNAQLAVTLLRIGEASMAPLPPPPPVKDGVEVEVKDSKDRRLSKASVDGTESHDENCDRLSQTTNNDHNDRDNKSERGDTEDDEEAKDEGKEKKATDEKEDSENKEDEERENKDGEKKPGPPKRKKPGALVSFFQYTAAGVMHLILGTDPIRASIGGSQIAKDRLGVINDRWPLTPCGPVEFKARHNGVKGLVLISTAATAPCLSFINSSSQTPPGKGSDMDPVFTVAISDIAEVKKVGGVGWKTRLVVGWAMEKEVVDGIKVVDRCGNKWMMTAMPLRDKLFDRLVAMGNQKWEVQ